MSLDTPTSPFDEIIDRRGSHCSKWDSMQSIYGVSPEDGLSMWVADMDFRPPQVVSDAVLAMHDHGVYGYFGDDSKYRAAIQWWMQNRFGWDISPDWIFSTHGLVNATGLCVDTFTQPGDGVALMTPVYHAFARVIDASDRQVVELPLAKVDSRYEMDFDDWETRIPANTRMLILCSPHNPGGRVWTRAELEATAEFCRRHDLILVSDEIHADLLMPGQTHISMATLDHVTDRLLMLTAATKTFNIAGSHIGNVIVPDATLRAQFAQRMKALGHSPNSFGLHMVTAAYSPAGAAWVDDLRVYLDGNRRLFDDGIAAIPGLSSMPLEATYLSWVDFEGTGMERAEFTARVEREAKIAANYGPTFGLGGETYLRFNIGTQRARVADAIERLSRAFGDLQ